MNPEYHQALIDAQYKELQAADRGESAIARDGPRIYVDLEVRQQRAPAVFRCRIDTVRYPVEPYDVGFLDPSLPRDEWGRAHDRDPRYWPFSFFPGIQGNFNIIFAGAHRTFWCRECTREYFFYHGDQVWSPADWTLARVVGALRESVARAEHPAQWRPLQVPRLRQIAQGAGVVLPPGAGEGDA